MLCITLIAFAAEPAVEPIPPPPPDHAEYNRLAQELESLSTRNAWAGADRTFRKMEATRVSPGFDALMIGAHAARAIGDMGAARDRLMAAKGLQEDREVIDWLWDLDRNYALVNLQCDPGSGWELTTDQMPFNPDHMRAIEYAAGKVHDACSFEGLLPSGSYAFAERPFDLKAGVTGVSMDLRGLPPNKKKLKADKKEAKARKKEERVSATRAP